MKNSNHKKIVKNLSPLVKIVKGKAGKQKGNLYLEVYAAGNNKKLIPMEGYCNLLDIECVAIPAIIRALGTTVMGRKEIHVISCNTLMDSVKDY